MEAPYDVEGDVTALMDSMPPQGISPFEDDDLPLDDGSDVDPSEGEGA